MKRHVALPSSLSDFIGGIHTIREISGLSASTLQRFNNLTWRSHFPRNAPPNPAKYSGERPEMSSQWRGIKESQNKKGNQTM